MRRKVANAAGGGMAHEEIAIGLGISRGTLEKHFTKELKVGACSKRMELLDALHRAGKKGNVAAIKAFLAHSPEAAGTVKPGEEPKPEKLGKKEQAQADAAAAGAGTEWGDLLKTNVTPIRKPGF